MRLLCPHLKGDDDDEFSGGGVLGTPAGGEGDEEGVGHHAAEINKQENLEPHACKRNTKGEISTGCTVNTDTVKQQGLKSHAPDTTQRACSIQHTSPATLLLIVSLLL